MQLNFKEWLTTCNFTENNLDNVAKRFLLTQVDTQAAETAKKVAGMLGKNPQDATKPTKAPGVNPNKKETDQMADALAKKIVPATVAAVQAQIAPKNSPGVK